MSGCVKEERMNRFAKMIASFPFNHSADLAGAPAMGTEALSSTRGERTMTKAGYSRREFLQRTAGIAGASIVGGSILLEADPLVALPRLTGASDRVRFGIVGVGMEGTGLLTTAIQLPGVECAAACDLYDGRHELAREIVGKPIRTTRRYKELLDDKEIDAIIIA